MQYMAFFDNSVCCETYDKMVRAVVEVDVEKDPVKQVTLNVISTDKQENKSVADFVTRTSNHCSQSSDCLRSSYICQHSLWAENHDYDYQTAALLLPVLLQLL